MDQHPVFLDEVYGGISLFLSGFTRQTSDDDESVTTVKHDKYDGALRRRKMEYIKFKEDEWTSVKEDKRSSMWNIILLNGTRVDIARYSSILWYDFLCRYFTLTYIVNFFKRYRRKPSGKGCSSEEEKSRTVNCAHDARWMEWFYEKEKMIPEPENNTIDTKSLSEIEQVSTDEIEEYIGIEPRMRCHHHADSLFSTSSGFTNYRGILNWLIVIALCSMGRTALENVIKYGILINPFDLMHPILENPHEWRCLRLVLLTNVYIVAVFWLERMMSKEQISDRLGLLLNSLTLVSIIVVPGAIVFTTHPHPLFSSITLGIQSITFLKLVSYVQVNKWCREQIRDRRGRRKRMQSTCSSGDLLHSPENTNGLKGISRELVTYPDNLTFTDLYYFMLTPTLCYELNFPRSQRIRKRFLIKRIMEMVFLAGLMMGLVQQWIVPIVHNSRVPFKELDIFKMLERLLKLAVPNHLIWLIFFYWGFHSCLNTVAEVICFGDRIFYRDWWNAENIREFWKNWNIPVHRWAIRHLYKPLVVAGYSPGNASIAVFLVSAFFHEYLLSIPLKMFRLWAFSAMLMQVPLAYMTRYMDQKSGNIVVWLSLIIGQPAAVLMYYHDYYLTRTEAE